MTTFKGVGKGALCEGEVDNFHPDIREQGEVCLDDSRRDDVIVVWGGIDAIDNDAEFVLRNWF